jgi:hypothetical protein
MLECRCIDKENQSSTDVFAEEGNVSMIFWRKEKMLNCQHIDERIKPHVNVLTEGGNA